MTSVARVLIALAALPTLAIMAVSAGPWYGPQEEGQSFYLIAKLVVLPMLAAWALAPYFVAHKFALTCDGLDGWWLIAVIPVTAIPVVWIYADVFVFAEPSDGQDGLVFAILPIFQSIAVLAVYGLILGWRRLFGA